MLQFSRPKQSYRGPQRYQMAYQHASNMAATRSHANGRPPRHDYDNGSVVGYIPDDISSVHSSALGGVGVSANYPPMFAGFTETWPSLPGARGPIGPKAKGNGVASSVAGDSVAASELTDTNGNAVDGKGGVSLAGVSLHDLNKHTSLSQSDRLKRYVESNGRVGEGAGPFGGAVGLNPVHGGRGGDDDDVRSISTAFASQIGISSYD